jgi:hypothetical protein
MTVETMPAAIVVDEVADRREAEQRRRIYAEALARSYTGDLPCLLCGLTLDPTAVEACDCPEPVVPQVDDIVAGQQAVIESLRAELGIARAQIDRDHLTILRQAVGLAVLEAELTATLEGRRHDRAAFDEFVVAARRALAGEAGPSRPGPGSVVAPQSRRGG